MHGAVTDPSSQSVSRLSTKAALTPLCVHCTCLCAHEEVIGDVEGLGGGCTRLARFSAWGRGLQDFGCHPSLPISPVWVLFGCTRSVGPRKDAPVCSALCALPLFDCMSPWWETLVERGGGVGDPGIGRLENWEGGVLG